MQYYHQHPPHLHREPVHPSQMPSGLRATRLDPTPIPISIPAPSTDAPTTVTTAADPAASSSSSSSFSAVAAPALAGGSGWGVPLAYAAARADASRLPARTFCEICGFWGRYVCLRCGARVCDIECKGTHEETRCQRFWVQ